MAKVCQGSLFFTNRRSVVKASRQKGLQAPAVPGKTTLTLQIQTLGGTNFQVSWVLLPFFFVCVLEICFYFFRGAGVVFLQTFLHLAKAFIAPKSTTFGKGLLCTSRVLFFGGFNPPPFLRRYKVSCRLDETIGHLKHLISTAGAPPSRDLQLFWTSLLAAVGRAFW